MDRKTAILIAAPLTVCVLGAYSIFEAEAASITARASISGSSINVYWNDVNDPRVDAYDISQGKTSWFMPSHVTSIEDTRNHSPGDRITYTVCALDKDVRDSSNAWDRIACDSVSVTIPGNTQPGDDPEEEKYPNHNRAPNAVIVAPSTVFEDTLVELIGDRTSDPNRDDLTYFWNVTDYDGYIWHYGENTDFFAPAIPDDDGNIRLQVGLNVSDGSLHDYATKIITVRDNTPPQVFGIQSTQSGNTLTVRPTTFDAENNISGYKWHSNCGIGQLSLFSGTMYGSPLVVDVTNKTGEICLTVEVFDYQHSDVLWTNVIVY